jgi:ABC-type glycerol-3-phosphate transport system substrate-binding protein
MRKQMNRMRTRILLIGLVLILVAGLAGCIAKGPAPVAYMPLEYIPEPVIMPAFPSSTAACLPAAAPSSGKSVNLTWVVLDTIPNLDAVVAAFEAQNPQIEVTLLPVSLDNYFAGTTGVLAAGCTTPDVLNLRVVNSAYYASYGWLASLWNQFTFDEKEDWIQALRKSGRYAREQYSAPFNTSVSLLFYNTDLLTAAEITPPVTGERWTWEKVAETAQKLTGDKNDDGTPKVWGFAWAGTSAQDFVSLPQSLGGEAIGLDGVIVKGVIDTTAWQDAFTFYANLFNKWKVSPTDETFKAEEAFIAGKLGMVVANAEDINKFADTGFAWGVAPYPYFQKGKLVVPTGDWQIGVNAKSAQRDAAMILVHWLTFKVGGEVLWREGSVSVPPEKNVLNLFTTEPTFETAPQSYWKTAAKEALIFTLPGPITPFYQVYDEQLQIALKELRGGADPKTTLTNFVETLSGLMK